MLVKNRAPENHLPLYDNLGRISMFAAYGCGVKTLSLVRNQNLCLVNQDCIACSFARVSKGERDAVG